STVAESDHPLLCESIRRQKGELALALLLRYKDDMSKVALIMDHLLDPEMHRMYKHHVSNAMPFMSGHTPKSNPVISNCTYICSAPLPLNPSATAIRLPSTVVSEQSGQSSCTNDASSVPVLAGRTNPTTIGSSPKQQQQHPLNSSLTNSSSCRSQNNSLMSSRRNSTGQQSIDASGGNMDADASDISDVLEELMLSEENRDDEGTTDYTDIESIQHHFAANVETTTDHSNRLPSDCSSVASSSSGVSRDVRHSNALNNVINPAANQQGGPRTTWRWTFVEDLSAFGISWEEVEIAAFGVLTVFERSFIPVQMDRVEKNTGSSHLTEPGGEHSLPNALDSAGGTKSVVQNTAIKSADPLNKACYMKLPRQKKYVTPSVPNQPSEAHAHFMNELAKRLLTEAGGNHSTAIFTTNQGATQASQPHGGGPHRTLHLCAFHIGLYALGLHNRVTPNWLSRTYSSHVSWISGQAMEIGRAAIHILIASWENHLTPTEVANLADKGSQSRDPAMVSASAELALSALHQAHALSQPDIQRALAQCKEQNFQMLIKACLAVEQAAKDGGVYTDVLFKVCLQWYNMYVDSVGGEQQIRAIYDPQSLVSNINALNSSESVVQVFP
uniref:Uncharacterized protein n=1 Tax=Romanomermis culicivorax TaxID=13658 RepID=A0A915INK7_ROMCU